MLVMSNRLLSNVAETSNLYLVAEQTKEWIAQIIVGLNFCPFAKKELVNNAGRKQKTLLWIYQCLFSKLRLKCNKKNIFVKYFSQTTHVKIFVTGVSY